MTDNEQNPSNERRGRGPRGDRNERRGHGRHRGPDADFGEGFPFGPGGFGRGFGPGGFGPGGFNLPPMMGGHHRRGPMGPGRRGRAGRGDIRMAVLHLLNEQSRNGYQMIQELAERTDGLWKPSPGAIYPALSALVDEGLITPDAENPKVFTLTDEGRAAVEASPEEPWASFQNAGRDFQASEHGALWKEFGKLATALRAVATSAVGDQLTEAADILARTRRDLFALLAAEPMVEGDQDDDAEQDDDLL